VLGTAHVVVRVDLERSERRAAIVPDGTFFVVLLAEEPLSIQLQEGPHAVAPPHPTMRRDVAWANGSLSVLARCLRACSGGHPERAPFREDPLCAALASAMRKGDTIVALRIPSTAPLDRALAAAAFAAAAGARGRFAARNPLGAAHAT
jgi:hypothetical protein